MATKAGDLAATAAAPDSTGDFPPRPSAAAESVDPVGSPDKRKGKCYGEYKHRDDGDDEDGSREAKRRRTNRQLSLEKPLQSSTAEGSGGRGNGSTDFSFSFDTRISAPIETTPKFGSFNLSLDLADFGSIRNSEKEDCDEGEKSGTPVEGIEDGEGKIVI